VREGLTGTLPHVGGADLRANARRGRRSGGSRNVQLHDRAVLVRIYLLVELDKLINGHVCLANDRPERASV